MEDWQLWILGCLVLMVVPCPWNFNLILGLFVLAWLRVQLKRRK
jgi:hypothetical protein